MTYAHATRSEAHGFGIGAIFHRIAAAYDALQETLGRHRVFRQTLNELGALSDRELADLGINRSMIPGIAMEAAEGPDALRQGAR